MVKFRFPSERMPLQACLVALALLLASAQPVPSFGQEHGEDPPTEQADSEHADSEHGAADDGHGDAEDHRPGAAHDPYDLSAANAGPRQEDAAEFRGDLALATLVVFGLLMLILGKFAWGPINEALQRREQGIADQLDEARRNNEEARQLFEAHQAKLANASEEVKALMDQARKDGDAQKQKILTEAETAAAREKDRAVKEIEAAKNSALQQLAERSVDQAVGLAGQIVRQTLSKDDHARLIQDALEQLPSEN